LGGEVDGCRGTTAPPGKKNEKIRGKVGVCQFPVGPRQNSTAGKEGRVTKINRRGESHEKEAAEGGLRTLKWGGGVPRKSAARIGLGRTAGGDKHKQWGGGFIILITWGEKQQDTYYRNTGRDWRGPTGEG